MALLVAQWDLQVELRIMPISGCLVCSLRRSRVERTNRGQGHEINAHAGAIDEDPLHHIAVDSQSEVGK